MGAPLPGLKPVTDWLFDYGTPLALAVIGVVVSQPSLSPVVKTILSAIVGLLQMAAKGHSNATDAPSTPTPPSG